MVRRLVEVVQHLVKLGPWNSQTSHDQRHSVGQPQIWEVMLSMHQNSQISTPFLRYPVGLSICLVCYGSNSRDAGAMEKQPGDHDSRETPNMGIQDCQPAQNA